MKVIKTAAYKKAQSYAPPDAPTAESFMPGEGATSADVENWLLEITEGDAYRGVVSALEEWVEMHNVPFVRQNVADSREQDAYVGYLAGIIRAVAGYWDQHGKERVNKDFNEFHDQHQDRWR